MDKKFSDKRFCVLYIEYIYRYIVKKLEKEEKINIEFLYSDIIKNLFEKEIFIKCFKSLVYCMNLERVTGNLVGDTPEERYSFFANTDYSITAMEKTFPLMKLQIYSEIKEKLVYILNVISSFKSDERKICKYFFGTEKENIAEIINSGDWHNNKCVVVILFESGNKIVFKPTKGENIVFLKEILRFFFCEEYIDLYDCVLVKNGMWVRFIDHTEIYKQNEINQFYFNYGKILFVSYLLGINDLHYENIIAHNQYPVITDVETIFSSYLFFDTHQFDYNAQYLATKKLVYGVMATGLIPIFSMTEYFGGDVSCLSNKGIKIAVERIKNENRDDLYIYSDYEIIKQYNHLPNMDIDPLLYGAYVSKGFEEATLICEKNIVKIKKYISDNLSKVEARIILNMTKGYSRIVRIKNEPKYRNNMELFNKLLLNLKRNNQFNAEVYAFEVVELESGNIPSFYWNIDRNEVYGYHKSETIKVLEMHEISTSKISEIIDYQTNDEIISEQKEMITDSIATNIALGIEYMNMKLDEKSNVLSNNTHEMLRDGIDSKRIVGSDKTVSWIGLMVNDKEQLEYSMLDMSLYSGIVGIGYMYISEYINKKDKDAKLIIQDIFYTIDYLCDKGNLNEYNISYFCGLTGIYAFLALIKENNILDVSKVEKCIEKIQILIRNNIVKTNEYDTLSGIHSSVIYFFSRQEKDEFARDMVFSISNYFLENFKIEIMSKNSNYASFAHGYSGIITSILCMNRLTKNERFYTIADKLLKYENKLYLGDFKWQDLRTDKKNHSHFWCHGSCGMMIARLIWKKYDFVKDGIIDITDQELSKQLHQYYMEILSLKLDTQNYSLCHGNFAFIDYLISYNKIFDISFESSRYIKKTKELGEQNGFSCIGAAGAINSLGFMVGESGIQYVLNRASNEQLPSILFIETI